MSTYLPMWEKIKTLSREDTEAWIRTIAPAKGLSIDFYDMRIIDVDLLEALRNWLESNTEPKSPQERDIEQNFYH